MSSEIPSAPLDANIPKDAPSTPATDLARAPPLAGRYYRIDSSRSSYTELWRDARSPLVLIAWLTKLLRVKLPGSVNDPNVVSLRPFVVADGAVEETIPSDVRQKFEPVVRELTGLGFIDSLYFSIHDRLHHSWTSQTVLLHRDGRSVALVTHRLEGVQVSKTHFFTDFLSSLSGGTFLYSSSALAQMLVPDECKLNWNPKANTSQLWLLHRQELEAAVQSGVTAAVMKGRDEVLDVLERHHEVVRDFHLERGVFSSLRGEDLAQAEAIDRNIAQAQSGQMRHPEVMAQIERLEKKQTNWGSALLVLAVSIGLFIGAGAGAWEWSWEMLLMIVGILLVHEAGHFLAMRIFDYRNVRMFFIPFFGAAVSGHHYNAPGWKKVIVSLMGPLPGILLGGVLGIAGIIKGNDLMVRAGMMTVILNGFQLLPVLPLDGGRIMHALLFSRHHYLDTIFQVLGVASFVSLGVLFGDKFLLFLGLFMLIGVRVSHKVAKITMELRQQGLGPQGAASPRIAQVALALPTDSFSTATPQPVAARPPQTVALAASSPPVLGSAEEHAIPQPVAEAIIDRTQARFPKTKSPILIAKLTLRVYETLATRPPGIAASLGFLFLHGASFITALVLLVVLVIPQNSDLMDRIFPDRVNLTCSIEPDAIKTWHGPSASPSLPIGDAQPPAGANAAAAEERQTIIATFFTSDEAGRAFDEVKQEAPASASLVHFGQSVFLSLPASDKAARTKWFDEFDGRSKDVFIDGGGDFGASLRLTCLASSESHANAIDAKLSGFFMIPTELCLIPPWAGVDIDKRSKEERARHQTARTMFRKLKRTSVAESPEFVALQEGIAQAAKRNNQAEHQRLTEQLSEVWNKLLIRKLKKIRDSEEDPIARELADRYVALRVESLEAEATGETADEVENEEDWDEFQYKAYARQRSELGPLMGRLPLGPDGVRPTPRTLHYSHSYGYVENKGSGKLAMYLSLEDVPHGAPAFLKWLKATGCRNFKYGFTSTGHSDYYPDE